MLPRPSSLVRRVVVLTLMLAAPLAAPLAAQTQSAKTGKAGSPKQRSGTTARSAPALAGAWSGTATVPLPDSALVVPVFYTFTQTGDAIGGTAMVPGQGSGPISNVVRTGARVQFRVTAPEGKLLEHDGTFGADGAIEGMVSLDKQPVAKFRITPKPPAATGR